MKVSVPRLSALTTGLFIFALVNILLINVLLCSIFPSYGWIDTSVYKTYEGFLRFEEKQDSWGLMQRAYKYVGKDYERPLYSELFFRKQYKFQYPPTSLLVTYFLKEILGEGVAALGIALTWIDIQKMISWLFVLATAFFVFRIFSRGCEQNHIETDRRVSWQELIIRGLIIFCLTITFYPIAKSYSVGQIQNWLNAIFSIVFFCWVTDRKVPAGVLLGIMALIKPQFSIILIWGVFRKEWKFVSAFALTGGALLLVSLLLFGITDHLDYLNVLSFISKHGEAYHPNQSINGLLNRLLFNGNNLEWEPHAFAPYHPIVHIGTTVSSLILLFLALFGRVRKTEKGGALDFSIIALTSTMASPVAWQHHYGIILPIFAYLLPCLPRQKIFGAFTIPYLCVSFILFNKYFAITDRFAHIPVLNIVQSYLLFGALMVLFSLYLLTWNREKRFST